MLIELVPGEIGYLRLTVTKPLPLLSILIMFTKNVYLQFEQYHVD